MYRIWYRTRCGHPRGGYDSAESYRTRPSFRTLILVAFPLFIYRSMFLPRAIKIRIRLRVDLMGFLLMQPGFENSAESGTTRPSRNRLEGDRTESDTRYDTITNSVLNRPNSGQTRMIRPRFRVNSVNSVFFENGKTDSLISQYHNNKKTISFYRNMKFLFKSTKNEHFFTSKVPKICFYPSQKKKKKPFFSQKWKTKKWKKQRRRGERTRESIDSSPL